MSNVKYLPLSEFQQKGYLQELNRTFLHPLGLALEISVDGDEYRMVGIWDYREDAEGNVFSDLSDDESRTKAEFVRQEFENRRAARVSMLGDPIQPIGSKLS